MPIEFNNKKYAVYEGDYHPAKLMEGNNVIFDASDNIYTGEELSITDTIENVATGNVRANHGVLSPLMEKRMINLLIIVLRAVVAVANAVIALLELIRELVD